MSTDNNIKLLLDNLLNLPDSFQLRTELGKVLQYVQCQEPSNSPIFCNWILQTLKIWEHKAPNSHTLEFMLKLTVFLMKNERNFFILTNAHFFKRVFGIMKTNRFDKSLVLLLSLTKILSSIIEHKGGLAWIIDFNIWQKLILTDPKVPRMVREEAALFTARFLERLIDQNPALCLSIINELMQPINVSFLQVVKEPETLPKRHFYRGKFEERLKLVAVLVQYSFEHSFFQRDDYRILSLYLHSFKPGVKFQELLSLVDKVEMGLDALAVVYMLNFVQIYHQWRSQRLSSVKANELLQKKICSFIHNFYSDDLDKIVSFSHFSIVYWKVVGRSLTTPSKELLLFAHQSVIINLTPLFFYAWNLMKQTQKDLEDILDSDLEQHLFNVSTPEIYRYLYFWRDRIPPPQKLQELCVSSLNCVKKSIAYYAKDDAIVVFKTLAHVLRTTAAVLQADIDHFRLVCVEENFSAAVFHVVYILLETFEMPWKDCLDSLYLLPDVYGILRLGYCTEEDVVAGLKLINLAIEKFLAPDLTLLVDESPGSILYSLGGLLNDKLQCKTPSIVIGALKVTQSITVLAGQSFPSMQRILLDVNIPELISTTSIFDGNEEIQIHALRCLTEMIKMETLWRSLTNTKELLDHVKEALATGKLAVRLETAKFVQAAYDHDRIQREALTGVYAVMATSTIKDPHWDVKIRGLCFWEKVILIHLQQQGMIDGRFPDVTFSKEYKKIITLTKPEIQARLKKVLNQLSLTGCLGVLIAAAKDPNASVATIGTSIVKKLARVFSFYEIQAVGPWEDSREKTHQASEVDYDQVISSNICVKSCDPKYKVIVTPAEFLTFLTDNEEERTSRYLGFDMAQNLDSLVHDLLKMFIRR